MLFSFSFCFVGLRYKDNRDYASIAVSAYFSNQVVAFCVNYRQSCKRKPVRSLPQRVITDNCYLFFGEVICAKCVCISTPQALALRTNFWMLLVITFLPKSSAWKITNSLNLRNCVCKCGSVYRWCLYEPSLLKSVSFTLQFRCVYLFMHFSWPAWDKNSTFWRLQLSSQNCTSSPKKSNFATDAAAALVHCVRFAMGSLPWNFSPLAIYPPRLRRCFPVRCCVIIRRLGSNPVFSRRDHYGLRHSLRSQKRIFLNP